MSARVEMRQDGPWLVMPCPKKAWCEVALTRGEAGEDRERKQRVWHWDGNVDEPTVSPSIGCDHPPRCGQHRVITAGKW